MSTDREKAIERLNMEAETKADHVFPDNPSEGTNLGFQHGFIAGRTISKDQVEAAAMTMHNLVVDTMWGECASEKEADMSVMRAAFRAAGFYVEGEE